MKFLMFLFGALFWAGGCYVLQIDVSLIRMLCGFSLIQIATILWGVTLS